MPAPRKDPDTVVVASSPGGSLPGEAPTTFVPGTSQGAVLAGRYELVGLVGVGGMGSVYRARDRELDEVVAVKVLRREIGSAPGIVERFRREVRLSRKVTHPNVARVFDIGEHDGDKYLTMEFIDGESLATLLRREGRLSIPQILDIMDAVCCGLGAAHRAGVIHRDLKPDNVLLGEQGRVVLTDFGIARALESDYDAHKTMGAIVGTPAYMAPEQVQGAPDIDGRADLYALGAILYEMLTAEPAWQGDGPLAVASARLLADPPNPQRKRIDAPDALARVVLRCMARARDDRYASVDAVAEELASLTRPATTVVTITPPPSAKVRTPAATEPSEKSVAVLPFKNHGAPADAYLAEELTDDLIDMLSITRGLKVRPRGVVARWKEAEADPREVGRALDVQVVVEGSVRRRDGSVRVAARLSSVADGFQLWAKRFDRPEGEVLRINDEVAKAVAQALTLEWSAPSRDAFTDPVALDLFLRGRHEYRRFWPDHLARALDLFDQALARAPGDPLILSACALARSRLWFFTGQGGEAAEQTAAQALAAAPDLPDARLAMAAVRFQRFDMAGAVRELKHALAGNPALAEAHALLGDILLEAGAVDEGLRRAEAAVTLDPEVPLAQSAISRAHALFGRWAEASAALDRFGIHESRTAWLIRGRYAMWRRDPRAIDDFKRMIGSTDVTPALVEFGLAIVEGRPESARSAIDRSRTVGTARHRVFTWQLQTEVSGMFNQAALANEALTRAVEGGLFDLLWMERCPLLDVVRGGASYLSLHAEVKRRAEAAIEAYLER